jgi:hypothetical protein
MVPGFAHKRIKGHGFFSLPSLCSSRLSDHRVLFSRVKQPKDEADHYPQLHGMVLRYR